MNDSQFILREAERARRLVEFVQGEVRNMHVETRMQFTIALFNYLTPEIKCLLKDGSIETPEPFPS